MPSKSDLATWRHKIRTDPKAVDEVREFQPVFLSDVLRLGYRAWHPRDVKRQIGKGPGGEKVVVLDWRLTKGSRYLWVELKAEGGKLSPEQAREVQALRRASIEVHVVKPSQYDALLRVLAGQREAA